MSAIGEASNQMLASAAAAISVVIGQEIDISPPTCGSSTTLIRLDRWGTAPHACSTSFTIAGEPCRLVQLVPNAFVVRMARAIDEISMTDLGRRRRSGDGGDGERRRARASITRSSATSTCVSGRSSAAHRLPIGDALELPVGALVDLDRTADAPVDLFINGLCFGHGHLLVTEDGEWAMRSFEADPKPALVGGAGIVADHTNPKYEGAFKWPVYS